MGLSISANKQLRSLAGLSKLSQVGDDVSIRGNPQLNTLAPLESMLKTVSGFGLMGGVCDWVVHVSVSMVRHRSAAYTAQGCMRCCKCH